MITEVEPLSWLLEQCYDFASFMDGEAESESIHMLIDGRAKT